MRDSILILLCAVALAQAVSLPAATNTRACNCAEATEICDANFDADNLLVVHPNCNMFYKCAQGKPVAFRCQDPLLYNPVEEICDWPQNVDCGDRPISDGSTDEEDCDDDADGNDSIGGDNDNNVPESDDNQDNGNENGGTDNEGTCNCNPGEAVSICRENDSDGTLIAHENCNQFYKCDNGKPVAFWCPGILVYNPYEEICDWPHNVNCGDRPISDGSTDDDDCDDDGNNGAGGNESVEDDNGNGIPETDDNQDNDNNGNENGGTDNDGTCNCDPGEAVSICQENNSDGYLIAHENCNQFYKCDNGKPVAFWCPGNLVYNPYKEICDWPENVDCGDKPIVEGESDDADNDGTVDASKEDENDPDDNLGNDDPNDNDNGGSCHCNPDEAPSICEAADSDGILIAHEDCDKFYKCDHGKPVEFKCALDLLYNPYTEQCDWPENVECGDRVIPDPDEDTDDNPGSGGNDNGGNDDSDNGGAGNDNDNGGTCNCNPDEAPSICEVNGSDGVLIAHEECNKFYKCDHGKPVVFKCPGALLYNPYTEKCDWPENVDCGDRVILESDEDRDIDDNLGNDSAGNDNGGNDNVGAGNCDPNEAPAICAESDSDGVLVAHENCNQFYMCSGGKPVALTCPKDLLFNPSIDKCDWPANVDCGDRVIPDPDEDTDDNPGSGGNDNGGNDDSDNGGAGNDNDNGGTCNCNPDEAPSICEVNGSDGVLIAHEECNKFYKCDHGKPVVFKCPGALLYNPYTEQCDWPENVDCGDRVILESDEDKDIDDNLGNDSAGNDNGGNDNVGAGNCDPSEAPTICAESDSDGVLVAHENCNQFYMCSGGKPVAFTCPKDLLFNPSIDQCDWPTNVDCGDRVIPDPDEDTDDNPGSGGNDNGGNDDSDNGGAGNDNDNGGTCNCNPDEAPSICEVNGSDGVLIAHEECNKFYKCDHGKPVVFKCPGALLYNPYTEQCDWPENVDCGDRVILESDEDKDIDDNLGNDSAGNDNGGNDNVGAGNCDPNEAPAICAESDSDGVLVAHENCNQFYMCSGGKPVALTCPKDLLFNPSIDKCDWPANVDCGDRVIPDPDEDTDDNPGSGGNDNGGNDDSDNGGAGNDNDNGGTCNCNPDEAPSICEVNGSDGVLIAHEECNKFYKCDHGKPVVFKCPGELLYNPYTEKCDWPENVDCGDRVILESDEDKDIDDNLGNDSAGNDNDGNDNVGAGNCDPSEAPTICAEPDSEGVLVAHENCNQFYMCSGGEPVALTCPKDLLFNPSIDQCDWPSNVDCGDRVIPDPDEDTDDNPGSGGNDNGGNDDNDNGGAGNDNDGTCNCNPDEAPSICEAAGSDGVLIAHEDCDKFYKCDHGLPVEFNCPENLYYNPYTEKCDWQDNVDCGDRIIPESGESKEEEKDPDDNLGNDDPDDNLGNDDPDDNLGNDDPDDNLGNDDPDDNLGNDDPDDNLGNDDPDDNDNNGTCNCNPDEAPSICDATGSDGVLIAHENCNQFYKCSNGKPVAFTCSGSLLYNPIIQQCDWPENVDCGDRVIPDPEDDANNDNSDPDDNLDNDSPNDPDDNLGNDDDSDNNGVNDDPSQAPNICAESGSDGVLVAHENCDQFYICTGGSPVAFTCAGGLLFNTNTGECDWPRNVDCGNRVPPVSDDDTCACNPRNAPTLCARADSTGMLVAHEDCHQFYMCAGGVPVARQCAATLVYNIDKQVCDWPQNVDCGTRVSSASLNKHLVARVALRK